MDGTRANVVVYQPYGMCMYVHTTADGRGVGWGGGWGGWGVTSGEMERQRQRRWLSGNRGITLSARMAVRGHDLQLAASG
jgi:hypothetical protein